MNSRSGQPIPTASHAVESSPPPSEPERTPQHVWTILVLLVPVVAVGWIRSAPVLNPAPIPVTPNAVDPNTAPWHELAALPGIGETKAKAIVRFRIAAESNTAGAQSHPRPPVFSSPGDLAKVRGIGPKTVARIAPHLWFRGS